MNFGVHTNASTPSFFAPPILTAANLDLQYIRGKAQPIPWLPLAPGSDTFSGAFHYEIGATVPCLTCATKVSRGVGCASPCPPNPTLALDSHEPVLGERLDLVTTGASPCAVFGATVIGFVAFPPGFGICLNDCLCKQYVIPDATVVGLPVAGQWTTSVPLPLSPSLCGAVLYAQSFTIEMPFAVVSSNYLQLTTGS
ncbi:MAG: hypothetical protein IPK26_18580 [Planctomycetes bacterium]|nr:hypothetical protein [Planctomycetota bacterium]